MVWNSQFYAGITTVTNISFSDSKPKQGKEMAYTLRCNMGKRVTLQD